jgi:hypothetical protein
MLSYLVNYQKEWTRDGRIYSVFELTFDRLQEIKYIIQDDGTVVDRFILRLEGRYWAIVD